MIQLPYHWALVPSLVTLLTFWWALRADTQIASSFGGYGRVFMALIAAIISVPTWLIFWLATGWK